MENKILDFIQWYLKYQDRNLIKEYIDKNKEYGTFDYAVDTDDKVVAIVRWNMDGNIAEVLDFAVREEYRNQGIGRDFVLRALERFPQIKYLRFKRGIRGDDRMRKISIQGILKRRIF